MDPKNVEDIYKLSPVQQALLFLARQAPDSVVSFEQSIRLQDNLNVPSFIRAWQTVIDRHAILRTAFVWDDLDEPLQVVARRVELPVEQLDWREWEPAEQKKRMAAFLEADRRRGIDVSQAPLMRLILIRLSDVAHQVIWSYHHILLDGWSTIVVSEEVQAHYTAFQEGRALDRPKPRPFRDYITWLRRQNWQAAETFWRQKLQGVSAATALPMDRAPGSLPNPMLALGKQEIHLSPETSAAAHLFARQHRATVNTLVQAAWAMLLSRYSGETDVVFGLVVHGRPTELSGFESMVGLFINGVPIRVRIPATGSILDWLNGLQADLLEVGRHSYTPLTQIQNWLGIRRNKPMFDYLLIDQSNRSATTRTPAGRGYELFEVTGYPLTLYLKEGEEIVLQIAYDRQRFDEAAIAQLLRHLHTLLAGMLADPNRPLADWSMLTPEESRRLLHDWNRSGAALPRPASHVVTQLFEAQVERTPHQPAVVWKDQSLTYAQLNAKANQLGRYLRTLGVGPETIVGLYVERSLEMVIGVLGVLKAGGAYLPLDPNYPADRIAFMLEDSGASIVLTQQQLAAGLPTHSSARPVINLDADGEAIAQHSQENAPCTACADNLVYVIYTSGSTGKSKGVMLSHRNLANAYLAWESAYRLRSDVRAHLQMASFSFDVFAGDLVRALCSGGKLVVCPRDLLLEASQLYALMQREEIDCAEFVPAVLRNLAEHLEESGQDLRFMRLLICGSDSWYVGEHRRFRRLCDSTTRLINSFGLTEATIDCSYFEMGDLELPDDHLMPLGRPFANMQLYILDSGLRLAPVGAPGELYIGGTGPARGYLNRPDLTAERFIPTPPFPSVGDEGDTGGGRLYKTGDLARWSPDGNVEFLGRIDQQVKIRGFRVELGEIESVLQQSPIVREAVVIAASIPHEESPGSNGFGPAASQRLIAYVVVAPGEPADTLNDTLRRFVQSRLPDYMVPSAVIVLDALPLTPNGKVDRRALPAPDGALPGRATEFAPPETSLEEELADIWSTVLRVKPVGILDNFFDLGGDSLSATQVINRVNRKLQVNLSVRSLVEQPTIAELALSIESVLIEEMERAV